MLNARRVVCGWRRGDSQVSGEVVEGMAVAGSSNGGVRMGSDRQLGRIIGESSVRKRLEGARAISPFNSRCHGMCGLSVKISLRRSLDSF